MGEQLALAVRLEASYQALGALCLYKGDEPMPTRHAWATHWKHVGLHTGNPQAEQVIVDCTNQYVDCYRRLTDA